MPPKKEMLKYSITYSYDGNHRAQSRLVTYNQSHPRASRVLTGYRRHMRHLAL